MASWILPLFGAAAAAFVNPRVGMFGFTAVVVWVVVCAAIDITIRRRVERALLCPQSSDPFDRDYGDAIYRKAERMGLIWKMTSFVVSALIIGVSLGAWILSTVFFTPVSAWMISELDTGAHVFQLLVAEIILTVMSACLINRRCNRILHPEFEENHE